MTKAMIVEVRNNTQPTVRNVIAYDLVMSVIRPSISGPTKIPKDSKKIIQLVTRLVPGNKCA